MTASDNNAAGFFLGGCIVLSLFILWGAAMISHEIKDFAENYSEKDSIKIF